MKEIHKSVLLQEAIDSLSLKEDDVAVDMTLGFAGHSSEILKRIKKGYLFAFDQDSEVFTYSRNRLNAIGNNFELIHANFSEAKEELLKRNITKVDAILYDLGVSSYQLDNKERGFSYNNDAVLDMRMNRDNPLTAKIVVNTYSEQDLTRIFKLYGESKFARNIARNIVNKRKEKEINTIYWVPSALCIVANLGALAEADLPDLRKVMFAGEVMPMKQLNMWRKKFPDVMFANLYGPTETTDICTYYIVDRKFENTETLPIGKHCNNCDVMIIKDDGTRAGKGEEGELCARGSFLAMGYYNNPEKTNSVFVQNPLNKAYPEIIYKTGDIVKENERGEIIYISRKDFQIKHMGYRIELGEIETAINAIEGIIACACVYDEKNSKIVLFYQGNKLEEKDLLEQAKAKLPNYMCPNEIHCIDRMPYNANGKIDRKELKNRLS